MRKHKKTIIRCIAMISLCSLLGTAGCGNPRQNPDGLGATPANASGTPAASLRPSEEASAPTSSPEANSPETAPTPTTAPEATPTTVPEATPTAAPEATPTAIPETSPTAVPETSPTSTADPETALKNLEADLEELSIRDADGIKGNIYLPEVGSNGSSITWVSSKPDIISDKRIENPGYDFTPPGVVARQTEDAAVTLTATLSHSGQTMEKEFAVTVLAAPAAQEYTDYLFAYFTGNGKGEESIFFSASQDGLQWEDLNGRKPVLTSALGTKGLRDPFLIRSAEGDRFFLIATDLCIASDGDWWKAQTNGSRSIMIWESEDLIHWSDQRMAEVNLGIAGCTWAPEAYYDEITGEYLVFWASRVRYDNYAKQRIYYVKTRDFYTFTEPQPWINYSYSTIDTTVIHDGESYYRFTKYEDKSLIIMERAETLLGEWTQIDSASLADQTGVEGPCCYALNPDDAAPGRRYVLLLDNFGGGGYYALLSESLSDGEFTRKRGGVVLPASRPRHGTVISLTKEEYEKVCEFYGK